MGNYLLDTHTAIWFFEDDGKLSQTAKRIILDPSNNNFVSIASVWELAIKISIGRLKFSGNSEGFMRLAFDNDISVIPIKANYLAVVELLPSIHRDPFDRLLVAMAVVEQMTLITIDKDIVRYNVAHVW
jgi:PIN domain nuclease of toxin-antitoxin system